MNKPVIKENERLEDLQCKGLHLIQNPEGFCFGIDAVLLSDFIHLSAGDVGVEFGTGTGVVPILASARYDFEKLIAFEIQPDVAEMATRSVAWNGLSDQIEIIAENFNRAEFFLSPESVDVVFSNPPYVEKGRGIINSKQLKAASRHELFCTVSDIFSVAYDLLKPRGKLYLVHRPERLVDLFEAARTYRLEPKKMRLVSPNIKKAPNIVLLEFVKHGGRDLKIMDPLYVYELNGQFTSEIDQIYRRETC